MTGRLGAQSRSAISFPHDNCDSDNDKDEQLATVITTMFSSGKASSIKEPDPDSQVAVSVPDSGDHGEGGKLKMIVQLVKKCLGVKDIASMWVSLPVCGMNAERDVCA